MSNTKHTPTPWKTLISGKVVEVQAGNGRAIVGWTGFDDCDIPLTTHKANARLIVRAVNAHHDLLSICEKIAKWTETGESEDAGGFDYFVEELVPELFAAIAAAKG